jgi:glycosyltransferase involved in cell wall biosynthesis
MPFIFKKMKETKITIIMATYNRAHFIEETIQSIRNQTYGNWECLIIDDGGTDNTFDVISPILNLDKRFKFYVRPDKFLKGLSSCRNFGLNLAKGDYIIFFDDDDIVHPSNLEFCLNGFSIEQVDFVHYKLQSFVDKVDLIQQHFLVNYKTDKTFLESVLTFKTSFVSCSVMWSKKCFKDNLFDEDLKYAEEWELYSRIVSQGHVGLVLNNVLYYNRKHLNSNTSLFFSKSTQMYLSQKKATELVLNNLYSKKLLNDEILRYFISIAIQINSFSLFIKIMSKNKNTDAILKQGLFYVKHVLYKLKKEWQK